METNRSFRKFKKEPLIFSLILLLVAFSAFAFFIQSDESEQKSVGGNGDEMAGGVQPAGRNKIT